MPFGTITVETCWSTAGVSASLEQSLVPFASGGIDPVQLITTVCPMLEGTVMLLVPGFDAIDVVIAARVKQATVTRMIFIRKLSDLTHGFSEP